jgi:Nif-specific regulatory protein
MDSLEPDETCGAVEQSVRQQQVTGSAEIDGRMSSGVEFRGRRCPAYLTRGDWVVDPGYRRAMGTLEDRVRLERDIFRRILALQNDREVSSALGFVLEQLVTATAAERAFIELHRGRGQAPWSLSHGCTSEETDQIRIVTSRGIVGVALAANTTLHVPYAMLDERFGSFPSVRERRLEAVLCIPIGDLGGGILYLEGRRGAGEFADADVALAEEVAGHIGPAVERIARHGRPGDDPTAPFRKRLQLDGIIGSSRALADVFARVEPFVGLDVTILITGSHGTGKTQLARAVHDNSPRRGQPFVEVNCAAIPENLIESELFGTTAGAFTGAQRRLGLVRTAEGGTLFLDEIAEIPVGAQAKLLQLLHARQYYVVGAANMTSANVRLIAATNADIPAMIEAKRFREDLFYRLNVVAVRMPSLAERRDDVALLVDDLLARIARDHNLPALPASDRCRLTLQGRDWPGSIRELRNELQVALIRAIAEGSPQIEIRHLRDNPPDDAQPPTFHEATRAFQRDLLRRELVAAAWNVTAVAERLDLSRAHVYNLINQLAIQRT